MTDYLPWFAVRSQYAPITIHNLLTHTAGIIGGSDFPLDPRFEVWALRDSDASPPGECCRYSNVGYKALGLLLEAVTSRHFIRRATTSASATIPTARSASRSTPSSRAKRSGRVWPAAPITTGSSHRRYRRLFEITARC